MTDLAPFESSDLDALADDISEGVVPNMPESAYHAHPALSSSGARKLLASPAKFHYAQTAPEEHQDYFDIGSAAHAKVLGVGLPIEVIDADNWRKKATTDQRDAAYAAGRIPLLKADAERVDLMAEAILANRIARSLLEKGTPEVSGFWTDERTGVDCRCRWDLQPPEGVRAWTDYKTTQNADPRAFAASAARYGYDVQAAWYLWGARELGMADRTSAFLFLVQEKEPPYLVSTVQLDAQAMRIGEEKARVALRIYAECAESGRWPGYPEEIVQVGLPVWAVREWEEQYA